MSKEKMMMFRDGLKPVTVGMKVIITNGQSGGHYRSHEDEITAVGRDLVTVGKWRKDKFYIKDGRHQTDMGAPYSIYSSRAEYERMKKESSIISKVSGVMNDWRTRINLEQALKIAEILNINLEDDNGKR